MEKKVSTLNAVLWSLVDRCSSQIFAFVIGIMLARLLSPHDYGIVGLMTIFLSLSNVFIDSGFANALIRKQNRTDDDLSTAFYFNFFVGIAIYALLWFLSPLIAVYFNEPILITLVRIAAINVVLYSLMIVQTALLTANLNIRQQTIINLCAQIPSGLFAIFLAFTGMGVYSLVIQTITASFLRCLLLWYWGQWRPILSFSFNSFKYLWNFGSKLLSASLIGVTFDQIYSVLIGKYISTVSLGYYSKSSHLKDNVTGVTNGIVQKIALPLLSRSQDSQIELRNRFREVLKILVMFVAPLSAFLCFSAYDIIVLLWSDKWVNCVIYFQLLIVASMFNPIGNLSLALMQVVCKTGLILKLEFPKKAIYCIFISIGFVYGIKGLCISQIFISLTAAIVNMWPTKGILKYSYFEQIFDLGKYMILSYAIYFCVYLISPFGQIRLLNILYNFCFGTTIYFIVLVMTKDKVALKLKSKMNGLLKKEINFLS